MHSSHYALCLTETKSNRSIVLKGAPNCTYIAVGGVGGGRLTEYSRLGGAGGGLLAEGALQCVYANITNRQ